MNENPPPEQPLSTDIINSDPIRAIEELRLSISLAKKFPRDFKEVGARIVEQCGDIELAEASEYAFPQGGTVVTGPSIRLIEAIARAMGNIAFGTRERGVSRCRTIFEIFVWDLEANTRILKEYSTPHVKKVGKTLRPVDDPRGIYQLVESDKSKRLRAALLQIIHPSHLRIARDTCRQTLYRQKEIRTAIPKLVGAFAKIGVGEGILKNYINCSLVEMSLDQLSELRRIYTALKEGHVTMYEAFAGPEKEEKKELVDSKTGEITLPEVDDKKMSELLGQEGGDSEKKEEGDGKKIVQS